jgi:hypothetical protein
MLVAKHPWKRTPYFHFHPMHNLYSLVMALVLFIMILFLLAMPAR